MLWKTRRRPGKSANGERGQALLEFTPLVVLMVSLAFAAVDFGRVIWQLEVVSGLTREGSDIASRTTPITHASLQAAVSAVISDGAPLNLSAAGTNGKVIITSVLNTTVAGAQMYVMTDQVSSGGLVATSKVGTYLPSGSQTANKANLPGETGVKLPGVTTAVPAPGNTVYVTEVFNTFSTITPLPAFVKYALPTKVYDIAFF
jgi:Flp pilus assembly protein TadG